MLIFAYSIYGGEKLTEKCLDKLDSNLCPREINIKFLEEKRKRNTHQETVNHFIEKREYKAGTKPNEAKYSMEKKMSPLCIKRMIETMSNMADQVDEIIMVDNLDF